MRQCRAYGQHLPRALRAQSCATSCCCFCCCLFLAGWRQGAVIANGTDDRRGLEPSSLSGDRLGAPQEGVLLSNRTGFRLPRGADGGDPLYAEWAAAEVACNSVRCEQLNVCRLPAAGPKPRVSGRVRCSWQELLRAGYPRMDRLDRELQQSGVLSTGLERSGRIAGQIALTRTRRTEKTGVRR